MSLRFPESMGECVYFTRRQLGSTGKAVAWVFRENCPKCSKGLMGKPVNPKTKKAKTRALEYVCPECNHTVEKGEYEDTLTCNIQYTCPECQTEGEIATPFKRQKVQLLNPKTGKKKAADAVVFLCGKCNEKIILTKKMKS